MKTLLIVAILLCLGCIMACEDIVNGDCPITVVGDTIYIFPFETDTVWVGYPNYTNDITVKRRYEDYDYMATWDEEIVQSINKVIVTTPSNHVYVLPVIRSIGFDYINYRITFRWTGKKHY